MGVVTLVNKRRVIVLSSVIIGVLVLLGLYLSSPGDGGTSISSVDVELSSWSKGSVQGEVRILAKDLDKDMAPDVRIEPLEPEGEGNLLIFNNDNPSYYMYTASTDSWVVMGESVSEDVASSFDGLKSNLKNWASEYGLGEHSVSYQGKTITIEINEINPDLSEKLFIPPEGAEVEEISPPSNDTSEYSN